MSLHLGPIENNCLAHAFLFKFRTIFALSHILAYVQLISFDLSAPNTAQEGPKFLCHPRGSWEGDGEIAEEVWL